MSVELLVISLMKLSWLKVDGLVSVLLHQPAEVVGVDACEDGVAADGGAVVEGDDGFSAWGDLDRTNKGGGAVDTVFVSQFVRFC